MPRHRRAASNASSTTTTTTTARDGQSTSIPTNINPTASANAHSSGNRDTHDDQEMASMYDYLAKVILLGPSGCGKSCLLHRFVKSEWRILTSQTIGVEFASKIVKIGDEGDGSGRRRKRIKLQLWDTAGTERFRSVSRSYYRGAAGAVLVYDLTERGSFDGLGTFLSDVRSLGSPSCAVVMVGNKRDLVEKGMERLAEEEQARDGAGRTVGAGSLLDGDDGASLMGSLRTVPSISLGAQQRATMVSATNGRAVPTSTATAWASQNRIAAAMEVSALSGDNVDEVFNKLARTILTKIELGEVDPGDPMSGIQYGDADYYRYDDGGSSIKSGTGLTSDGYGSVRRKRRSGWGDVFRIGRKGSSGGGRSGCC